MNDYKLKLIELAAFYEKTLTTEQIKVYAQYLSERLTLDELKVAMNKYCDDPTNEFFPRPISKLVVLVHVPVDDDAQARDAAARVIHAISKYGWCNSNDARAYVGELGWAVVNKQGGWVRLCEASRHMNFETFQAQARDLAKSQLSLARAGMLDQAPGLPGRSNVNLIEPSHADKQKQLASMINQLATVKEVK